jgi:hypothetical protein
MRNLEQYPITAEEVLKCLNRLKDEAQERMVRDMVCGDMSPLLLAVAAQIITKYGDEFFSARNE